MSTELDFALGGEFVKYELEHHVDVHDVSKLARKVGVDRGALIKFLKGFAGTRAATLRRIELALELPEYTIDLVREHDLDELAQVGLGDRPMRWLQRRIDADAAGGAADTSVRGRNYRAV